MARRGAPSTYELLKRMSSSGKPTGGNAGQASAGGGLAGSRGGRPVVLEISLVWMVVIAVVFVVGVVLAYNMGTRSGGGAPDSSGPSQTPGSVPGTTPGAGTSNTPNSPNAPNAGGTPTRSPQVPVLAATDNNGDPRVKGFKYYVLAHPSTERAPAMVEFCRTNGLDAYLVPDDNAMLRKIVVLPGYRDSSEKNSEVIRRLEADIRRVGEKWKNSQRGNKDFSDAYPENFR
jgi:hypothetical protein